MLSVDQQFAYNCIKCGENLFITARAGGGKSFLINYIRKNIGVPHIVCGSTGISACNVAGRTLHSMFMIPPRVEDFDISKLRGARRKCIEYCKLLIIDEISMVSEKLLNKVSEICCQVRCNNKPFGGIQVVFFGDYLQLPPVNIEEGISLCCDLWNKCNVKTVLLTTNHRQKDDTKFYDILTRMRYNSLTIQDCIELSTRFCKTPPESTIRLFGTNEQVAKYNLSMFNKLPEDTTREYKMDKWGDETLLNTWCKNSLLEETLQLREGTRVMCLVNNLEDHSEIYNGSLGTVTCFDDNGDPFVKFDMGMTVCVHKKEFTVEETRLEEDSDGKKHLKKVVVMEIKQIPLKQAWGITIHKSQGLTFDSVFVDCSRIFSPGQIYVAFSRCQSLQGLYLANFDPKQSYCDINIVRWYTELERMYSNR